MTLNRISVFSWQRPLAQVTLLSLGLIVIFALIYWGLDQADWGMIVDRSSHRQSDFLSFLYFSIGTFFRIGYGDQVPIGAAMWVVGLEALSHFLVQIAFIAHMVISTLDQVIWMLRRERLEDLLNQRRF